MYVTIYQYSERNLQVVTCSLDEQNDKQGLSGFLGNKTTCWVCLVLYVATVKWHLNYQRTVFKDCMGIVTHN
uniref:Uncharacterized protein n=1 Tax=Nelumbo nucifera TaxID=4432 RepID=A0A822YA76_NELNU|nr:TPA_asm: hypothetical protein HUJ06_029919 [Nelumbo nucifera]